MVHQAFCLNIRSEDVPATTQRCHYRQRNEKLFTIELDITATKQTPDFEYNKFCVNDMMGCFIFLT